ncbi:MAG: dTDP-4-dehydrorhamnose reductase [Kiritimatiellia bacterium]|jgi:dTDP-4-dehydrorhamnose reductase
MSRILIAGCRGQLGRDCMSTLARHELRGLDIPDIDITSAESVQSRLADFRPDVVVNCAAYTAVDQAESDVERCRAINADGPRILAEACRASGAYLVHISTDYVFDGRREPPRPWLETDATGPATVYGRTKLEGEQAIAAAGCRHAILRTAWLYGAHGRNFPKTMLRLALANPDKPLRVVADQFGCPTWSARLARQIKTLLEQPAPPEGLFHAVASGHTTWHGFASEFLRLMAVPHAILPCTTAEYPTPAKRPANSILENAALANLGLCVMDDWRTALSIYVATHRDALIAELG